MILWDDIVMKQQLNSINTGDGIVLQLRTVIDDINVFCFLFVNQVLTSVVQTTIADTGINKNS